MFSSTSRCKDTRFFRNAISILMTISTRISSPVSLRGQRITYAGWLALFVIACFYLLPGLIGHGPWKQDETYSFGIIHTMLETSSYLVPTNAGQPFVEKPPLYYWVAVMFAKSLHPWLDYPDAARMASLAFMAITFCFVLLTARLVWDEPNFFSPRVLGTLALFAGTVGMVKHAHDMFTDVALVCGAAIAMYGLLRIVINEQNKTPAWPAALYFGLGVGIALLSKGFFIPIGYAATAAAMACIVRTCRSRSYARMVGLAILVSLPFFVIWPALLAQHSMPLFMEWFWENNVGRFLGFSVNKLGSANDEAVLLRAFTSFALPCAPLAAFAVFSLLTGNKAQLIQPRIAVPLVFVLITGALLISSATVRQLYLLPLILPLCLLGSHTIARLPDWFHVAWDWFARLFFGAMTALVWLIYTVSMLPAHHHDYLSFLAPWLPLEFVTPLQPIAFAVAILFSLGWIFSLPFLKPLGQWRGAFSWFAGLTLSWGVTFTLLLPWLDYAKSYEYTYTRLADQLAPFWRVDDCMASVGLGESEAPTLYYYAHILHQPLADGDATSCRWLIVVDHPALPDGNWIPFWTGGRDGDRAQTLRVFQRQSLSATRQPAPLMASSEGKRRHAASAAKVES